MHRSVSIAAFLVLSSAFAASACRVIDQKKTILQKLEENKSAYHGTIVANEVRTTLCSNGGEVRVMSVKVAKAFGPAALPGATVYVTSTTGDCGVSYPVGTEVVLFPDFINACSRDTVRMHTSENDFNEISPSQAQLDSLYGITTAIAVPAKGEGRGERGKSKSAAGPVYGLKGSPEAGLRRGDGRLAKP